MHVDFLLERFANHADADAVIWRGQSCSYRTLLERYRYWWSRLEEQHVRPGSVVSLAADFSPNAITLLLALIERGCIVVPLTTAMAAQKPEFLETAEVEWCVQLDERDEAHWQRTGRQATHALLRRLADPGHPGLVLFSSGSTGRSKAAVHDLRGLLEKFKVPRAARRAIAFLLYDHIGGINTLLYQLSNGGCVVTVPERSPSAVLHAIAAHRVDLLPTSPTFLRLILLSRAYEQYDLSSLKLVTYGTEPMPESTLREFHERCPQVELLQTYGLSELGILRSKSRSSDSLWVRLGGEGFATRIVNGLLEVKAQSAMLGYLNAPSPFTEDGWFRTGDAVEVDGEWLRILGRRSEMINVGGEKVYPAEVESVIQEIPGVEDVVVVGEPNAITGNLVVARVKLAGGETVANFRPRLRAFCAARLPRFKIPQKVELLAESSTGERFKRIRKANP